MASRRETPRREQPSRERLPVRDQELLVKMAEEVEYWQKPGRDQLIGAKPYHRALDNGGFKNSAAREEWLELLKAEVKDRKRKAADQEAQRREAEELLAGMKRVRMFKEAYAHERSMPPDTYGADEEAA
jgi:hypothetical protein